MKFISELNQQISSSKMRILLLATPIVVGSGVCLYYYYRNHTDKANKPGAKIDDPLAKALALKNKGNDYFRAKQYTEAINVYTEGIQLCPSHRVKEMSNLYQNRAACYEHLQQFDNVINDCSQAISNNKLYIKAYVRRAKAYEQLKNYEGASFDYYVAAASTNFQNNEYLNSLYEVLEKFSSQKARDVFDKRKTHTFQKYLLRHIVNKFSRDPLQKKLPTIMSDYDKTIASLLQDDANDDELDLCDQLLKGTIEIYSGRHQSGESRLLKIWENTTAEIDYRVNALIKVVEYCLLNGKLDEADKWLKEVEQICDTNPDLYYMRSQLHINNKNYENAISDLDKSFELDPTFQVALGQKFYIQYQQYLMLNDVVNQKRVLKEFDEIATKYSNINELIVLYFQVLVSNNETKKAERYIIKALENDSEDPTLYVYRALVCIEEGNLEKTKEYLDTALSIDSKCSFAYEIMADLCNKIQNFKEALAYFECAINCATTFDDIKTLTLKRRSLELQLAAPKFD